MSQSSTVILDVLEHVHADDQIEAAVDVLDRQVLDFDGPMVAELFATVRHSSGRGIDAQQTAQVVRGKQPLGKSANAAADF
jgi:hypothetical protein